MFASLSFRQQLTQQQRNNKRQRASSRQLQFLLNMFGRDPKPDQKARERIGNQIDMTPRSVQIWFQNKRAKIKKAKASYNHARFATLQYRFPPKFRRPKGDNLRVGGDPYGLASASLAYQQPTATWIDTNNSTDTFDCSLLEIGSWVRVRTSDDLCACYNQTSRELVYTLRHTAEYKIKVPSTAIKNVQLFQKGMTGTVEVHIADENLICCEVNSANGWKECTDFTGGALRMALVHRISGDYDKLLLQTLNVMFEYGSVTAP